VPAAATDREDQLDAILADYLRGLQDGTAPSRDELLATHPEYRDDLRSFFDDRDAIDRAAAPLRRAVVGVTEPVRFELPRPFGPYRLEAELGRGGMGVVYRAADDRLRRSVAVKVLPHGPLAGDEERLRLRLEAEAIARLGYHPHIVPVLDVGVADGHAYLAMQLVEGPTLAQVKGRFRGRPRAIAALVATLADTLHHAHQRGVLHRDLKPSNVLLAAPPGEPALDEYRPVVTDFGLARLLAAPAGERPTLSGAILGTPSYMAPEQARGEEATLAIDVYGLGAILYELLTGRPPHQGPPLEVLRKVVEVEPVAPRRLDRTVPRDLETVCLKALAKEPAQRYASAKDLADDLRRYLAGEPVVARPVGTAVRVLRWTWRQPLAAGLLAGLVVALAGGATAATVLWLRAEANFHRAEREAEQAEAGFDLAHEVVRDFCLRVADEAQHAGGLQPTVRDLLQRALRYYDRFLERHADDPALAEELATTHDLIGKVHLALGDRARGVAALAEARDRTAAIQRDRPDDPVWMRHVVGANVNLGTVRDSTEKTQADIEHGLALADRFLDRHPADVGLRSGKAHALANLGAMWERRGDWAAAAQCYEQACALLADLATEQPDRESVLRDRAYALTNLGGLRSHNPATRNQALDDLAEARQLRERLLAARPGDPRRQADLALCLLKLGVVLREAKETKASNDALAAALKLRQALVDRDPAVIDHQVDLAATLVEVGFSRSAEGDKPAAIAHYRRGADLLARAVKADPDNPEYRRQQGILLFRLGAQHGSLGQRPEERAAFEASRVPLEWLLARDADHIDARYQLGRVLHNLAYNRHATGEPDAAVALIEEALPHSRRALERAPGHLAYRTLVDIHYLLLAEVHAKQRRPLASLEAVRQRRLLWPTDGARLYHSAWEIARILNGPAPSPGDEDRLWAELEASLRAAQAAGFRDWGRVQREAIWQPLRDGERLKAILAGLRD